MTACQAPRQVEPIIARRRVARAARPRAGRLVATGLVVATMFLVAGCSIGTDDSPRDLAVSTTTTALAASPTSGGSTAVLYFVKDGQLVPNVLALPDHELSTVLDALLKASAPSDRGKDLTTSIPVGTRLTSERLEGGTLSLDLSGQFDNVVGPSRQQAIAQIVMTATEFPGVDRVRFSVGGKPVQVATPTHGDSAVVTDCDYRTLLAKPSDLDGVGLGAATMQRLQLRQANLRQTCTQDG